MGVDGWVSWPCSKFFLLYFVDFRHSANFEFPSFYFCCHCHFYFPFEFSFCASFSFSCHFCWFLFLLALFLFFFFFFDVIGQTNEVNIISFMDFVINVARTVNGLVPSAFFTAKWLLLLLLLLFLVLNFAAWVSWLFSNFLPVCFVCHSSSSSCCCYYYFVVVVVVVVHHFANRNSGGNAYKEL